MPQRLTFNPVKTKTGDKLFFLLTNGNQNHLRQDLKMQACVVVEKKESIYRIGPARCKRKFHFKLALLSEAEGAVTEMMANEHSHLFTSVGALAEFVCTETNRWRLAHIEHMAREKENDGILYANE